MPTASHGSVVVVWLLGVAEEHESLTFSSGYPSVAELFRALRDRIGNRLPAEQMNKIYFRLPHGGEHAGVASSSSALNWQNYLCIEPCTYVARIATQTPPSSSVDWPASGAGAAAAALKKVVLTANGA